MHESVLSLSMTSVRSHTQKASEPRRRVCDSFSIFGREQALLRSTGGAPKLGCSATKNNHPQQLSGVQTAHVKMHSADLLHGCSPDMPPSLEDTTSLWFKKWTVTSNHDHKASFTHCYLKETGLLAESYSATSGRDSQPSECRAGDGTEVCKAHRRRETVFAESAARIFLPDFACHDKVVWKPLHS